MHSNSTGSYRKGRTGHSAKPLQKHHKKFFFNESMRGHCDLTSVRKARGAVQTDLTHHLYLGLSMNNLFLR